VSKATIGTVLALSVLAVLSGCSKPQNAAKPAAEASTSAKPGHPVPFQSPGGAVSFDEIKKADGGQTIAEIYAAKDQLGGKTVTFRGKVVKSLPNVMKSNWLHVRDGSGQENSNDLAVSSPTLANIGDTVLVTGKVTLNKDLGLGYKYDILIEDAKVTIEKEFQAPTKPM